MALILCPECENQISEHAPACPHCGCPMPVIQELILKRQLEEEEEKWKEQLRRVEEQRQNKEKEEVKRLQAEEERKRQLMEWEYQRELEQEKKKLEKEEEIRQYKSYLASLKVGPYDTITIKEVDNDSDVREIIVNPRLVSNHKIFLGLKYGEIFTDKKGTKWKLVGIEKNDPYKGIESVLPGRAVSNIALPRNWAGSSKPTKNITRDYDVEDGYNY